MWRWKVHLVLHPGCLEVTLKVGVLVNIYLTYFDMEGAVRMGEDIDFRGASWNDW